MSVRALLLAVLLAGAVARAHAGAEGTTGANLLKVAMGCRQAAMGGVGVALPGNLSVAMTNPALLSFVSSRSVELEHWPGLAGISTEYASYSMPLGWLGTWAGSVMFRTMPTIDNVPGTVESVEVNDGLVSMGLGRPMGRSGWLGGLNIKLVNSVLGDVRATSVALDAGAVRSTAGTTPIRYAFAVDNLGNPMKHEAVGAALPLTIRGGASWSRQWFPHKLTMASEAWLNNEMDARAAAGIEWVQQGKLALRAGINAQRFSGWSWSLGTGWRMRSAAFGPEAEYEIDYAYVPIHLLTQFAPTHAFSLYIKF